MIRRRLLGVSLSLFHFIPLKEPLLPGCERYRALLKVNGYRLLGINHMEVVSVLKELPIHVRMVCGRNIASQDPLCPIDTAQHQAAFQTRVSSIESESTA